MKEYCVYAHSVDGRVFYVGCGSNTRPHDKSGRSAKWKREAAGGYKVRIVKRFYDKATANSYEMDLIWRWRPSCNTQTALGLVGAKRPKPGHDQLTLWMPQGGRETLKRRAYSRGMSLNAYAVAILTNGKIPKCHPEVNPKRK